MNYQEAKTQYSNWDLITRQQIKCPDHVLALVRLPLVISEYQKNTIIRGISEYYVISLKFNKNKTIVFFDF
jgi:hypothetical protein